MAIGDLKVFDFNYSGLTLQVTAIDLGNGQVEFSVQCLTGHADINALYWADDVADGNNFDLGTKKDNSLNMNGTGVDWDGGYKVSSTGLGSEGTNKSSYLTAGESYTFSTSVDFASIDTLGIRATSTSTADGSIKGVDNSATEIHAPTICVDDAAPVVEGDTASFKIHLDHAYSYDVAVSYTTVGDTATDGTDYTHTQGSIIIHAGETEAFVTVATTDDAIVEPTEHFTLHLTGATADIPDLTGTVGNVTLDLSSDIECAYGTGTIEDNDVAPPVGPPTDAASAFSHGYWSTHGFGGSEGFAGLVGSQSFDAFFGLDTPTPHTWVNPTSADKTFTQAVSANGNDPDIVPAVSGNNAELVREAATAVLNFADTQSHDSFVDWYIYERQLTDPTAAHGALPTDSASALTDLIHQVDLSLTGQPNGYSVGDLAALLEQTHHA
jgi:hypothetical protein